MEAILLEGLGSRFFNNMKLEILEDNDTIDLID
jgi:hypothetical protein